MSYLDGREEYYELEEELKSLPKGTIVRKTISGRSYPYLQWHEGVKTKSRYLKAGEVEGVKAKLARRADVEARLEQLKGVLPPAATESDDYRMMILTGDELSQFARAAEGFGHRRCFRDLQEFLGRWERSRVLILYGLRRTGKTTLMQQALLSMGEEERSRAAYIQSLPHDTMTDLACDLRLLRRRGYRTIFIDEVTLLSDFIDSAAMLSDVFAAMRMTIVLSGTDSLGFWLASGDALYDRSLSIHTTFIPFAEWSRLLGINDVDDYIAFGGTFVRGVERFDERGVSQLVSPFIDENSVRRYIDTAIVGNIQHSLEHYRDGGRFGSLYALYERNELTSAINRVIEDMNHRFVRRTIERTFVSHDLRSTAQLLRDAPNPRERILLGDYLDEEAVTERLRHVLDILEADERTLEVGDEELADIQDYLRDLELIDSARVVTLLATGRRREGRHTIFLQPGMRYCQAKTLVQSVELDDAFQGLSIAAREHVVGKILDDIRGRMLEDIVLFETSQALAGSHEVFKLVVEGDPQLGIRAGEYDMVIRSVSDGTVSLYEVKHSDKQAAGQTRHLVDEAKLALVEATFGPIVERCVLYRGPAIACDDVSYANVEEYLVGL